MKIGPMKGGGNFGRIEKKKFGMNDFRCLWAEKKI